MAWLAALLARLSGRPTRAERLAEALCLMPEAVALFDARDRLLYCNESFRRAHGVGAGEAPEGRSFVSLLQDDRPGGLSDRILDHHQSATGLPMILRRPDGRRTEIRSFRTADGGTLTVRADIAGLVNRGEADGALIDFQEIILRRKI